MSNLTLSVPATDESRAVLRALSGIAIREHGDAGEAVGVALRQAADRPARRHGWTDAQVRAIVSGMRKNVAAGWDFMVPAVRRAMVAQAVLGAVVTREQSASGDEIAALLDDACSVAGVEA